MITCSEGIYYRYAGLSTDTKPIEGVRDASTFWETDTGKKYEFRAEEKRWHLDKNIVLIDEQKAMIVYQSGNYFYICFADPGTLASSAKWQIKKVDVANLVITWANGNANYVNAATNLGVVAALPYS